ncbi:hypothetical protein TKK_0011840 [Trichogramma kaykai]
MDKQSLINELLKLILDLTADPNLPRNVVDTVMVFFDNFNKNNFMPSLKADILNILKNENLHDHTKIYLNSVFKDYENLYETVNTEANRFNLLRKIGYEDPKVIKLGFKQELLETENEKESYEEPVEALWLALRTNFQFFLEMPGVLNSILDYYKTLLAEKNTNIIRNIVQADLYRKKYENLHDDETIFLPYYFYFDEFECGNALGSHAGKKKFSATYAQLACLPPWLASRLNCIFLVMLVNAKDQKYLDNCETFGPLVKEANFLTREGITVIVNKKSYRIKFELLLILGDNLGLNEIFGFTKSFNANYYCRICKITSSEARELLVQDDSKMRTREQYDKDAITCQIDESGLEEPCFFHNIDNFHITENSSVDVCHDFLEGVCSYDLHAILKSLIHDKQLFPLEDFNELIKSFDYSLTHCNNPPEILPHHFQTRSNLKMSAAELSCLTRYLPLIIGDLVDEEDEHWQLLILLRKIYDIITSNFTRRDGVDYFKQLVREHHELYIQLYGSLKPKHHFLIHYPDIMIKLGPAAQFSTIRFESRHRHIKSIITSTSSKKNSLKTIGIKEKLRTCEMMHAFHLRSEKSVHEMKKNEALEGIHFSVGMVFPLNVQSPLKIFGKITDMTEVDEKIMLTMESYVEEYFDSHFYSYAVRRDENHDVIISCKDLCSKTSGIMKEKYVSIIREKKMFVCFASSI